MNPSRRAFTLIELLVVVAIIALLLATLAPACRGVLRMTRETICRENIRQLSTAFQAYAAENRHDVVSCMEWVGIPQANPHNSYDASPYKDSPDVVQRGKLWPYVVDQDIYRCSEFMGLLSDPNRARLQFSYVMNGNMNHMWRNYDPDYYNRGWYKYVYRKLVHIGKPEQIFLFGEEMPGRTPGHSVAGLNDGVLLTEWYPGGDALGYLHGEETVELGYSMVSFVDGHTERPHIWETATFSQDPF